MPRASLLSLLLLVLLTSHPAEAQRRHQHDAFGEAGRFALAFEASWLAVGPFMGGVGGRYWVADRTVLTASLRGGGFLADREFEDGGRPQDESDAYQTGLSLGVERHAGRSRRVSPFVALGTSFDVRHRESFSAFPEGGSARDTEETLALGGSLFVGAEYRFAPGLTLAAAHALGAEYSWGEFSTRRDDPDGGGDFFRGDLSTFSFGTSTTRLVLSVYF